MFGKHVPTQATIANHYGTRLESSKIVIYTLFSCFQTVQVQIAFNCSDLRENYVNHSTLDVSSFSYKKGPDTKNAARVAAGASVQMIEPMILQFALGSMCKLGVEPG